MSDALVQDLADDIAFGRVVRSVAGQVEDVSQAYDLQDALRPHLGAVCGRKIAANAPAMMEAVGLDAPLVGMITGAAALASGAELRISDYAQLALEPEFAVVVGTNVLAGTVLDAVSVQDYIERVSLAFEVLDRRNDPHGMHPATYVANNIFNAGVVLGAAPLDPAALAAGGYHASFTAVGETMVEGENTAPQDPFAACAFVINHFTARGEDVMAGEVILCGAHHPPMVICDVGKYDFALASGEAVSLSISA